MMRLLTISTIFALILSGCTVKEFDSVSGQKLMQMEVVSPSDAELFILPAEGSVGNLNPGYSRVGFTSDLSKSQTYTLKVTLTPID